MDRTSSSTSPSSSSYRSSQMLSPKESVWALYCRSMLLWNFCGRLRKDSIPESEKAECALEASAEAQAIQDSLDMHVCNLNTALTYMAREYVYKYVVHLVLVVLISWSGLQHTDDYHTSPTQVSTYFREVRVKNPYLLSPSLQGLDSGSSVWPTFNRKQAEEWCTLLNHQD